VTGGTVTVTLRQRKNRKTIIIEKQMLLESRSKSQPDVSLSETDNARGIKITLATTTFDINVIEGRLRNSVTRTLINEEAIELGKALIEKATANLRYLSEEEMNDKCPVCAGNGKIE
jgi:hypothetical protein